MKASAAERGRREKLWARQVEQASTRPVVAKESFDCPAPAAPPPRDGRRGERHRRGHSRDAWGPG